MPGSPADVAPPPPSQYSPQNWAGFGLIFFLFVLFTKIEKEKKIGGGKKKTNLKRETHPKRCERLSSVPAPRRRGHSGPAVMTGTDCFCRLNWRGEKVEKMEKLK